MPAAFFARPAADVARDLLGAIVVSTLGGAETAGRIVEVEAYVGPHDPASHAAARIGRTARNAAMFGPPGTAYVYRSYGIHWCLNFVTDREGYPAAVLVRAIEPIAGVEIMTRRRGIAAAPRANLVAAGGHDVAAVGRSHVAPRVLAGGPGRLTQAMGITGALDGHPLDRPPLIVAAGDPVPDADVVVGPRIGITRAVDWPLRFHVRGSAFVSR
ncbi:MAG TPA: DNA-3-methyladenine glycosylase [Longimicrobiales bacterium]|nr:DNA-3-methyladenine glycosylase [Longimicrobiales bacterium]